MRSGSETVVLVGPADSYRLGPFLRAAILLGMEPVVVTDRVPALGGAVRRADLGCFDPVVFNGLRPRAVVATDSVALHFAAAAAQHFGLHTNSGAALLAAGDKAAQRHAAAHAGVAQPRFVVLAPGDDAASAALEVGLPAVIKPTTLCASRGVIRVDDPLDARAAAALVRNLVGAEEPLLVEAFVPGGEVAVEGLIDHGRFHCLAIFDKPDAPQGPTFPETMLVAPSRLPAGVQAELVSQADAACRAMGLRHGPVHVEFRIDRQQRPQFLELAARTIGGRCAAVLTFAAGATLEELVLRQALGLAFDPTLAPGAVGVLMLPIPQSGRLVAVEGVDEAAALADIVDVTIDVHPGDRVHALPAGDRYAGFVFARAEEPAAVESALAKAASTIRLVFSTG